MRAARIASLALVTLLAAAVPAGAQSLSEDDCRTATGMRASCVGAAKLGERVSAECRRLGVLSDEQCWSRVGRRVVRAEVDAYEDSWTHRTLAFQYSLGHDVPLRNAPWVGTHNSYNSPSEDPTLSHTDSNQQLSVLDQLRLDVRALELDVHWTRSHRAGGAFAPVVCHARDRSQGHAGCTTERLLGDHMAEIAAWLAANEDEVLLLYLEDHIADAGGYAASAQILADALGARLYRPRAAGCNTLPLDITRDDVLAAGAQVIVVGSCGDGAWPAVSHSWPASVRFEDRPRGYRPYPQCGPPDRDAHDRLLVRYYEDATFLAPALAPTGATSTDDGLTPDTVGHMVRCGVDLIGFDALLPRDGRLDALVWSWADGEPRPAAGGCTAQRAGGRWESAACNRPRLRPACRDADGGWRVLGQAVKGKQADDACAEAGLSLGTPRTGHDNELLRDARGGTGDVWIGQRTGAKPRGGRGRGASGKARRGKARRRAAARR